MDTKIIFVGNYKGGVGKTTSVLNFAEYFSKENKKVLVLPESVKLNYYEP